MAIQIGPGTVLQLYSGSYSNVANITGIGGPEVTVADIDITVLASTGFFKQYLAGFADGGVVSLECIYEHLVFSSLWAQLRVTNTWRIVFPDNSRWDFSGYINAIKTEAELENALTCPFSIKITGVPTFTP